MKQSDKDWEQEVGFHGSIRRTARENNIPESTLRGWLRKQAVDRHPVFLRKEFLKEYQPGPSIDKIGRTSLEYAEAQQSFYTKQKELAKDYQELKLLQLRRDEWEQTQAKPHPEQLISVTVPEPGPYALMLFGDLHLDDSGTNFPLVEHHVALCRDTPGVYGIHIGDIQNGWAGRLMHLWAEQRSTGSDAWELAKWFFLSLGSKLLLVVRGNHDYKIVSMNGYDVLEWLKEQGDVVVGGWGVRVKLVSPHTNYPYNGGRDLAMDNSITVNARHDFSGSSAWNPVHGAVKAAMLGWKDDILVCGHTHISGYTPVIDPATRKVSHCIRTASYKHRDSYAQSLGPITPPMFECPTVVVDPREQDTRYRVVFFPQPEQAIRYLNAIKEA